MKRRLLLGTIGGIISAVLAGCTEGKTAHDVGPPIYFKNKHYMGHEFNVTVHGIEEDRTLSSKEDTLQPEEQLKWHFDQPTGSTRAQVTAQIDGEKHNNSVLVGRESPVLDIFVTVNENGNVEIGDTRV